MLGIPFHTPMEARFHLSLTELSHFLINSGTEIDINYSEGTLLSGQRNRLMSNALDDGYDLLMIDSDMVFKPSDALSIINTVKYDQAIVGGLCFARRFPFKPVVFHTDKTDTDCAFVGIRLQDIPNDYFRCAGIGTGIIYIPYEIIKKFHDNGDAVGWPFNIWTTNDGDQMGEDLSFCHRCTLLDIHIYCQPNVNIGHLTSIAINRQSHLSALEFLQRQKEEELNHNKYKNTILHTHENK